VIRLAAYSAGRPDIARSLGWNTARSASAVETTSVGTEPSRSSMSGAACLAASAARESCGAVPN
jgi:hypothetical protein